MAVSSKKRRGLFQNIQDVKPLTDGQRFTIDAYNEGFNLLLHGVAGTGKTYVSLALAVKDIIDNKYQKLYIIRSNVTTRDPGFLPGDLSEKSLPYEKAYGQNINQYLGNGNAYNILKENGLIEFLLTSFLRALTFDNCIIFVDEIQNMTFQELDTIITRVGNNSRIIFAGDINQNDLQKSKYDVSGLNDFIHILENMESIDMIEFGIDDIVRSGLVREYIIAKNNIGIT